MSEKQLSALQGVVLSVLAALVVAGALADDVSKALVGVVTAVFVAVGAFVVKRPRDH